MDSNILSSISNELNMLEEKCAQGSEIINNQSEIINTMNHNMHKIETENNLSKTYLDTIASTFSRLSKKMNKLIDKNDNKIDNISLIKRDHLDHNSQLSNIINKIDSIHNISSQSSNVINFQNDILEDLIVSTDKQTHIINNNSNIIKKYLK